MSYTEFNDSVKDILDKLDYKVTNTARLKIERMDLEESERIQWLKQHGCITADHANEVFDSAKIQYGMRVIKLTNGGHHITIGAFYPLSSPNLIAYRKSAFQNDDEKISYTTFGQHSNEALIQLRTLATFSIADYPVCCGLKIFNNFSCLTNAGRQQAGFNEILLESLKIFHREVRNLYTSRIEAVFVSNQRNRHDDRKSEPQLNSKVTFIYEPFRKFFYEKAVKIQAHSFYNYNSDNTLEKCEALFDKSVFPHL